MRPYALLLTLGLAGTVHAASLLTLYNPVADGSIDTTPGNNDRSDWITTTAFPSDSDEGNLVDFAALTVAHDSTNFYLREEMYRTNNGGGFLSNQQIVFFDTDQSMGTGYTGPSGSYAIGAEYLLEGPSLFSFTGGASQSSFSWAFVATVVYDDFPVNDHELTISRANLGNATDFDLMALSDYFGNGDIYPDSALGGGAGGYYSYTTVPEPSTALLAVLGLLAIGRRRR